MTEFTMKIPFAHPVSDGMRAQVLQALRDIERQEDVRVLYACESGSRAWGFASPDSDYDVRFIYVRRVRDYLRVNDPRDVIEQPISGELDVSGWDLRKALQLLTDSNPTLLEWLRSPIVYRQDDAFAARLRAAAEAHFLLLRGYHHYVSMAKKNLREHLYGETVRLKKYLYVMRPLMAARWIRDRGGAPPMVFAELVEAMLHDDAVLSDLRALLAVKMRAGEAETAPRRPVLQDLIERELAEAQGHAPPPPQPSKLSAVELDGLLCDEALRFDAGRGVEG